MKDEFAGGYDPANYDRVVLENEDLQAQLSDITEERDALKSAASNLLQAAQAYLQAAVKADNPVGAQIKLQQAIAGMQTVIGGQL